MSQIPLDRWHIEVTTKCQVACSRCMRTEKRGSYAITDLDLNLLDSLFTDLPESQSREVLLCGSLGDAIYHHDFHGLLAILKKHKLRIHLNTNGSGFTQDWWTKTLSFFDQRDSIILSIDGLADTNHLYRHGSRFETIENIFPLIAQSEAKFVWKYIVFRHNQHQMEQAKTMAKDLGFAEFILTKSNRFGPKYDPKLTDDELRPEKEYISNYVFKNHEHEREMRPLCLSRENIFSRGIYVTAEGFLSPCCWTGANFTSNPFTENRDNFDLNKLSVMEILMRLETSSLFQSLGDIEKAPSLCKRFCSYNKKEALTPENTNTNSYQYTNLRS